MDRHMEERKDKSLLGGLTGNSRRRVAVRTGLMTAIAVILVMSAVIGSAWAYFTTYATAKGGITLALGHEEHMDEEFSNWEKVLNITSTGDSRPVYLRARAFSAKYNVSYSDSQNWTKVGDWMYYEKTLAPGSDLEDSGDQLRVQIVDVPRSEVDPTLKDGNSFNVIVVYESTEVQYDENGNAIDAQNADWNGKVDTNRTSTTLGGDN